MRLVQLLRGTQRAVALVEEPNLRLVGGADSILALARAVLSSGHSFARVVDDRASTELLEYEPIYSGRSEWKLLPAADNPAEPARCLVTGTGLTHLGSAKDRQSMHTQSESETDSMRMFRWGVEGGRPAPDAIGTAPEWFYKGNGSILRAHGQALPVPAYAEDGGEEAEIAGVYLVDPFGIPVRIGMVMGNEFSDHKFEKRNYLNLAGSKIRACSIGPELVADPSFASVKGRVAIERSGQPVWSKEILTGESEMCHSLRNIEHHHFKFESHRRPGDLHIHFYGAPVLSFGDGVELQAGDVMSIQYEGFGRPLRNPVSIEKRPETPVVVRPLA